HHSPSPLFLSSYASLHHPHPPSFPTRRSSDLGSCVAHNHPSYDATRLTSVARISSKHQPALQHEHRKHHDSNLTCDRTSSPRLADRKSTRLNSSHQIISYAVFCLKKKNSSQT